MATAPPMADVPSAPPEESLLVRIARAIIARERHKLGIPEQEQRAELVDADVMLRRAQAAYYLGGGRQRATRTPSVGSFEDFVLRKYGANPDPAQIASARTEWATVGQAPQRAPISPPNVGSFEDFVVRSYGQNPTPEQIAQARKTYMQADDRPPTSRTTVSLEMPIAVMDKQTGKMTYVSRKDVLAEPDRYTPPPTATERNVAAGATAGQQSIKLAQNRALPVLADLGSRAMALNRGSEGGILARAGGMVRGVAGRAGADSAADLYRTGVRGFTPLIAAAVGHKGVLTELDVQRTEDLFPRIGDADAVTREKLARIQRIVVGQEPLPFAWSQPSYDEAGITVPGSGAAVPNPGAAAPGGLDPAVQRILDALRQRSGGQ